MWILDSSSRHLFNFVRRGLVTGKRSISINCLENQRVTIEPWERRAACKSSMVPVSLEATETRARGTESEENNEGSDLRVWCRVPDSGWFGGQIQQRVAKISLGSQGLEQGLLDCILQNLKFLPEAKCPGLCSSRLDPLPSVKANTLLSVSQIVAVCICKLQRVNVASHRLKISRPGVGACICNPRCHHNRITRVPSGNQTMSQHKIRRAVDTAQCGELNLESTEPWIQMAALQKFTEEHR